MTTATLISAPQMLELLESRPEIRILDVRTGAEFESEHIPGSLNVPLDTLGEHASELADVERPVVLVCRSGARATKAHQKLTAAGKDTIHVLDGGIQAWEAVEGEMVRGENQRWAMDRQVRLVAGSLVMAGVLTSVAVPKAKWLAAGVAGGLVFSAVSDTCAMGTMLGKLPYNRTDRCDIDGVLEGLAADARSAA